MMSSEAFVAVNRFGLGASRGELAEASADPRGWVRQQLSAPSALPAALAALPPSSEAIVALATVRRQSKKDGNLERKMAFRRKLRKGFVDEAGARTVAQIESRTPAIERLVAFWSNHFTVSVRNPVLVGIAGAFEREAIRPHVTGRFSDMLLAVMRHPAMLAYLDNVRSIGPNSVVGRRRGTGLNENLAREALELHTLGVDGGYTQQDVRELAKMLTGWSIGRVNTRDAGHFRFYARAHEPGAKTLLGRRFAEAGAGEAEAALRDLARHPATARHIAVKLARHFVADQPPEALIDRLSRTFQETDGDLRRMTEALLDGPEAWSDPLAKVKTPNEFVVSALRLTGFEGDRRKLVGGLRLLGQMPFTAPSPAGWPDEGAKWIGAEALLQRAEFAMALSRRIGDRLAAADLLAASIDPVVSAATRTTIRRAPSRGEALATLFASPEFQRR